VTQGWMIKAWAVRGGGTAVAINDVAVFTRTLRII